MIIEYTNVYGWEAAIRGMRNPMNSWEKSDSRFDDYWVPDDGIIETHDIFGKYHEIPWDDEHKSIGPNDHDLMMRLAKAGTEHSKYRRMIVVYADVTAPLYWWKEFDTYKVGTVANSCSTMHKIHAKEFTLDDFSCEHLITMKELGEDVIVWDMMEDPQNPKLTVRDNACAVINAYNSWYSPKAALNMTINMLNRARDLYLETKDKKYWWQMIQLLPTSYNQKRTVMLNYENLAAMYRERKDHKLDEWHTFCDWIKGLPYSELITLEESE